MLDDITLNESTKPDYSVPPVVRAIKVLRHIAAGHSVANQSKAARAIGINRTTLLRLLHTLEAEGLIERVNGSDEFILGTGIIDLAARKISSLDVAQVAQPVLARLTGQLGLSSHLGILDGREALYVLRNTANRHLVANVNIGTRMPAHASSLGSAILAHMPISDIEALYADVPLVPITEKTATSLDQLMQQLQQIRAQGYADARSSYEIGIDAIAAPIFDYSGRVVAAINVSGPTAAFGALADERGQIAIVVLDAAREISRQLGNLGASRAST